MPIAEVLDFKNALALLQIHQIITLTDSRMHFLFSYRRHSHYLNSSYFRKIQLHSQNMVLSKMAKNIMKHLKSLLTFITDDSSYMKSCSGFKLIEPLTHFTPALSSDSETNNLLLLYFILRNISNLLFVKAILSSLDTCLPPSKFLSH